MSHFSLAKQNTCTERSNFLYVCPAKSVTFQFSNTKHIHKTTPFSMPMEYKTHSENAPIFYVFVPQRVSHFSLATQNTCREWPDFLYLCLAKIVTLHFSKQNTFTECPNFLCACLAKNVTFQFSKKNTFRKRPSFLHLCPAKSVTFHFTETKHIQKTTQFSIPVSRKECHISVSQNKTQLHSTKQPQFSMPHL